MLTNCNLAYRVNGYSLSVKRLIGLQIVILVLILSVGCQKNTEQLRIGIIKPSIDHLPLTYTIAQNELAINKYKVVTFTSGWEAQEALIGKKIDVAILPFTFAWNAAAKGYPVKIVSFLERQSDGIVVRKGINRIQDLNNKRIGVLKASTIDVLMQDFAVKYNIQYTPVYFRSPNEQIAALRSEKLDGIVSYVPTIQKLDKVYPVLHWFGTDYPMHPCCDIVVNTESLSKHREKLLYSMCKAINKQAPRLHSFGNDIVKIIGKNYGLNREQAASALEHTGFMMGLELSGRDFERKMVRLAVQSGYIDKLPSDDDIYWDITSKYEDR